MAFISKFEFYFYETHSSSQSLRILFPEVWEKNLTQTVSPIPPSPPPQESNGQALNNMSKMSKTGVYIIGKTQKIYFNDKKHKTDSTSNSERTKLIIK